MTQSSKTKLQDLNQEIGSYAQDGMEYICITDIARYKNPDRTDIIVGTGSVTVIPLNFWEFWNS